MDERNINIARKVLSRLYIATIWMIVVDIFYRTFALRQRPDQYEDLAIIMTVNVFLLLGFLLYYGGLTLDKIKPLKVILFYIGFVVLGTIFTALKYRITDFQALIGKVVIIASICAIMVALFLIIAYLGKRRVEKEISEE